MVATIPQIIGKINPELYAENGKELLAKYGSAENIQAEEVKPIALVVDEKGRIDKNGAEASHRLVYNSGGESLEPLYFFIIDLMNDRGLSPQKLIDNFTSTPGSSHFAETGLKASRVQDEASKLLANAGIVLKGILNIIYDLKEFKIRLQYYADTKSKDRNIKEASILSLKQIWMDKVDYPARGNSSIKAMALGQMGFQTLIDAFLIVKTPEDTNKLDLNDQIKRIVKARVQEFNIWVEQSEKELRKRYEMEKIYLKQQVNSLKLYSRWAKPYLRAAQKLEMKEINRDPRVVNLFNTVRMELVLFGKEKVDPKVAALTGELPRDFKNLKIKRDYFACSLIEVIFTAIPQQGGRFSGRLEVIFKGYALNQEELDKLDYELDKSDIGDVLTLIEGATTESLEQLQNDIDEFLEDKTPEQKAKEAQKDESNPFLALIGFYNKKEAPKKTEAKSTKKSANPIRKDDWIEKNHLRRLSTEKGAGTAFQLFDTFKKAHGMPSYT
ncbi:hypothetical protein J4225_04530 [Candidatus Pacearchaeota archaeon]|nr:hypothetical protein [Candidatus Pacearchaeota archaeon]